MGITLPFTSLCEMTNMQLRKYQRPSLQRHLLTVVFQVKKFQYYDRYKLKEISSFKHLFCPKK